VSTHLYRAQRLGREQLLEIAAYGFEVVELFASPTHVDFHNPAGIADLQQWLAEAGLTLASVHAPMREPRRFIASDRRPSSARPRACVLLRSDHPTKSDPPRSSPASFNASPSGR